MEIKTLADVVSQLEKDGIASDNPALVKLMEYANEEKEINSAETYLELPDAQIAKVVRKVSNHMGKTKVAGWEGVMTMAATYALLNSAIKSNAGSLELSLDDFTNNGESQGDWEIIVRQKETKNG